MGKRMSQLDLTAWQRRRLRRQLTETLDARVLRRTLAVLEFDRGRPVADLARMLGVTRQSVYNWIEAYCQAHDPEAPHDEEGRWTRMTRTSWKRCWPSRRRTWALRT
jgi:transposase